MAYGRWRFTAARGSKIMITHWKLISDETRGGKPNLICEIQVEPYELDNLPIGHSSGGGMVYSVEALIEFEGLSRQDVARLNLPSDIDPEPIKLPFVPDQILRHGWLKEEFSPAKSSNVKGGIVTIIFKYDLWNLSRTLGERV